MWANQNKCKHVALQLDETNVESSRVPINGSAVNETTDSLASKTYMHDWSKIRKRHKEIGCKNKILGVYSSFVTLALVCCMVLLILCRTGVNIFGGQNDIVDKRPKETTVNYCLNPACISLADTMIKKVNANVDPCDDFYEYACGRWIQEIQIPEGYIIWNVLQEAYKDKYNMLKKEFEKPSYNWGLAESVASIVYNSCMNEEYLAKEGDKALKQFVNSIGGWGLSPNASVIDTESWTLENTLLQMYSMNFNPILWITVVTDDKNTSRHVIALDQALLTLRYRDIYVDPKTDNVIPVTKSETLSLLQHLIAYIGLIMGDTFDSAMEKSAKLINFEAELAKAMPVGDEKSKFYYLTTLKELISTLPGFNWKKVLNQIFAQELSMDEPIVVYGIEWLHKLVKVLNTYSSTTAGKQIVDNYVKWFAVFQMLQYVDKSIFNSTYLQALNILYGYYGEPPRYVECIVKTEALLSLPVSKMLVKIRNDSVLRTEATELINYMVDELQHTFKNISWMDEKTAKRASNKVLKLEGLVGYSDDFLDANYLNDVYSSFDSTEKSFFKNALFLRSVHLKENVKSLHETVNRKKWNSVAAPMHVNAFYTFPLNRIVIPLAILSNPIFSTEAPMPFNFGSIGAVVGHELTHAFDPVGRMYDEDGNMNNWWEPESFNRFSEKSDCFVHQYSNYSFSGMQLNGNKTLSENIADNGGLIISYKAFKTWAKEHSVTTLPGLNVSTNQLFFLAYAQFWCSKAIPEFRKMQIEIDKHAVEKYRVIGSLSNFPDFAEEFHCPLGSRMNPVSKCSLW